jgi:serine/threonine-protein kinase
MNPERWREVTQIYGAVVSQAPERRAAAVAELCGGDEDLRREIESLLQSKDGVSLLERAAVEHGSVMQMLTIGSQIGVFRIDSLLGVGGMGEVYRARDTKLNRDVAIKILPPAFANDPDRLARFKREAQVLASLNHPNVGGIYGFEDANGIHALVLELVDGPTLAERLQASGSGLPLDEALGIARQIADALEAAHEQGIIHRDLKPANIKVREDGTVKVLDFGLAKLADPVAAALQGGPSLTQSPTITTPAMTQAGMILGTAAYMSPEQAKGRPADKRSDIWAFGCVLFEMLTGKRAFDGEDVSDTLANILKAEPNWAALPARLPQSIRDILQGCLQKDRKHRLGDFSTIRFLASHQAPHVEGTYQPRRSFYVALATGIAVTATVAIAVSWRLLHPSEPPAAPTRFEIVLPASEPLAIQGVDRDIAISVDGRQIAYRGGLGLQQQLFLRRLDQLAPVAFPGTSNVRAPFFSADGKWIGFWQGGVFYKISVTGGPKIALCQPSGPPRGASWGDDNMIILATNDPGTGLLRVPASGGEPQVLTKPDPVQHESDHLYPFVMPGSRAVLFTVLSADATTRVAVLDVKTGQQKTLIAGASQAEYVDGHLVYVAGGALRAIAFDPNRLEVVGDPVPVSDQVMVATPARALGAANFTVSRTGTLLYVPAEFTGQTEKRSLVWVDRSGRQETIPIPPRAYVTARLSPDESQVALEVRDQQNDISILDLRQSNASPRRLTFDRGQGPVWTPDGKSIVFASARTGAPNLFRRAADGSGSDERLTTSSYPQFLDAITRDGDAIGFEMVSTQYLALFSLKDRLRLAAAPASNRADAAVSRTSIQGLYSAISPNGRYMAYQSANENGGFEIFVRPFPNLAAGMWQVSTEGGARPVWSRNSDELFYFHRRLPQMMSVATHTSGSSFSFETPEKVFDWPSPSSIPPPFDVSKNGLFLMIKENTTQDTLPAPPGLVVIESWIQELKARSAPK